MNDAIDIPGAPAIPGLRFRHFCGESDYPRMAAIIALSAEADRIERVSTVEDLVADYAHLTNSDPHADMLLIEVEGQAVGYSRGWWMDVTDAGRGYGFVGFLVPAWRRKGIGQVILNWMEGRLRAIAASHPADLPKFFQVFASQFQEGTVILLERNGYRPVRYFHEMVRSTLEDIPDIPLPTGLEVRPVQPEQYHQVLEAVNENFRDVWGHADLTEEDYQAWMANKRLFQPELWQVAWDLSSGKIAGHVITYIDHQENEKYGRKRGYTETIGVARAWRKQGVASALIAGSLRLQKEAGMSESALGVDSENPSGASRLYEACGFRVVKRNALYRKPM